MTGPKSACARARLRLIRRALCLLGIALCLLVGAQSVETARAFPYVVQEGDTLAKIAQAAYGKIQNERLISTANALDQQNLRGLTPGQILQVPALRYVRVSAKDSWKSLARQHLGHEARDLVLAQVNGHKPWIQPESGQLIAIPYNLPWLASGEESLATLAYRFLGSTKYSYRLMTYNQLEDGKIPRGTTLLLPIADLQLTEKGRAWAEEASRSLHSQTWGPLHAQAQRGQDDTALVASDVRAGRYLAALSRGNQLLGLGALSKPKEARLQRLLLEAYTALGAEGSARAACSAFRELEPSATLDPLTTSPKILGLCPNPEQRSRDSTLPASSPGSSSTH